MGQSEQQTSISRSDRIFFADLLPQYILGLLNTHQYIKIWICNLHLDPP